MNNLGRRASEKELKQGAETSKEQTGQLIVNSMAPASHPAFKL